MVGVSIVDESEATDDEATVSDVVSALKVLVHLLTNCFRRCRSLSVVVRLVVAFIFANIRRVVGIVWVGHDCGCSKAAMTFLSTEGHRSYNEGRRKMTQMCSYVSA